MENKHALLLVILFLSTFSFGQNSRFGVSASGGTSWMSMSSNVDTKARPSARLGMFYENSFHEKWSIKAGVFLDYLKSEERIYWSGSSSTFRTESILQFELGMIDELIADPLINTNDVLQLRDYENDMLYVGLPVLILYNTKRIAIRSGFKLMRLSFAGVKIDDEYHNLNDLPKWDYGPTAGFEIKVSSKVNIVSDFYLGLKNVRGNSNSFKRKNRQATLGLNYYLTK